MEGCPICQKEMILYSTADLVVHVSEDLRVHYDCFFEPLPKFKNLNPSMVGFEEQKQKKKELVKKRSEELINKYALKTNPTI